MRVVVRVVSLAGAVERRARVERQLAGIDVDWSFFDALRAPPAHLPIGRYDGRELTSGELGCFASHYALWRWFVEESAADRLVVLEDDTVLDPDFFSDLHGWLAAVGPLDLVRLYGTQARPWIRLARIRKKHLVRFLNPPTGTQAYVLTRNGAAHLIAAIDRIDRPADDELNRFWVHGVLPHALHPYPVLECCGPSSEGMGERRRKPLSTAAAIGRHLRRLSEDLRRVACNLRLLADPRSWRPRRERGSGNRT